MKTRARRVSGETHTKDSAAVTATAADETETASRKPTLTVINNEGRAASGVRPKVHMYPKRVKEATSRLPKTSDEYSDSASPETPQPMKESRVSTISEPSKPDAARFDPRFALGLVVLVVVVNMALLMLVGASPHATQPAQPETPATVVAATPAESGVMIQDHEVRPITLSPSASAPPAPSSSVPAIAPVVQDVVVPVPVAQETKPVAAFPPALQPDPARAVPPRDLLSIINQN